MIKCLHIEKSFKGKTVISNLSFMANTGEVLVVNGNSGAGKTTLLDIVAGISNPDSGERSVLTKRIGYAFQDDRLVPWKTVRENLEFVIASYFPKAEAEKIVDVWLWKMGLSEAANQLPAELSGGMKKRLNIARSMAIKPELLLLDEPFAFQDNDYQKIIWSEAELLNKQHKTTIILTCHHPLAIIGDAYRSLSLG